MRASALPSKQACPRPTSCVLSTTGWYIHLQVSHGRGGDHRGNDGLCRALQKSGFTALSIEQRNHGERLRHRLSNAAWSLPDNPKMPDNPSHAVDMYSQVVGTAQDCSMLIDALPAKFPELSMENGIGCCGISQGGR